MVDQIWWCFEMDYLWFCIKFYLVDQLVAYKILVGGFFKIAGWNRSPLAVYKILFGGPIRVAYKILVGGWLNESGGV